MVKTIYGVFVMILIYLRIGDESPTGILHFDSPMVKMVRDDWTDQTIIGWDGNNF